jgi:hypothetical protein
VLCQYVEGRVGLHQLTEGDLHGEGLLDLQRDLGQREGVEPQFEKCRPAFVGADFDAGDLVDQPAQLRGKARVPATAGRGGR